MQLLWLSSIPAGNYMFKANNRNTRTKCEICSKLTIKIAERHQWRRSGIFIVNFELILHLALVFVLLTLSRKIPAGNDRLHASKVSWKFSISAIYNFAVIIEIHSNLPVKFVIFLKRSLLFDSFYCLFC